MSDCSRRERKKQETRQRLLEAAWSLFQEKGYENATVQEITEAADVGKGTFFNYFETKEAILADIAVWQTELLSDRILSAEDVPDGTVARIKLVMAAMALKFSPEGDLAQHLLSARLSEPARRHSAHRLGSILYELVVQGQARQEIRQDVDAGLITHFMMSCVFHYIFRWHRDVQGTFSLEDELIKAVDALMNGLGGPEWRNL